MRLSLIVLAAALVSGCPAVREDGSSDAGPSRDGSTSPSDVPTSSADVPAAVDVRVAESDAPADASIVVDVPADAGVVPTDASDRDAFGDGGAPSPESGRVVCYGRPSSCERPSPVCCSSPLGGPPCAATIADCGGIAGACDGPEDCSAGERCVVLFESVPGVGFVYTGTRCSVSVDPDRTYLCQTDVDCLAGERCCEYTPGSVRRCGGTC